MITLLHGSNIIASRTELNALRERAGNREIRALDGRGADEDALREAVSTQSLFGSETLVVIENLFGPIGRKTKLIRSYGDILKSADSRTDIILWESKELGKEPASALGPNAQIKFFTTPPVIFELLDSLNPDPRKFLGLLPKALEADAAERVYFMLADRVRQLIQVKDNVRPARISPFQLTRLTSQARSFTIDQLMILHGNLAQNEFAMKSGQSPFTAKQSMECSLIGLSV